MHPELERLIDLALADGVLSDKERQVLYRKAQELDVDLDEFEMVLDAKTHIADKAVSGTQSTGEASKPRIMKEGEQRKCPSCGSPVLAFATTCTACGHEFRGIQAAQSVERLFDMLNELEQQRDKDETNPLKAMGGMYAKAFAGQSMFSGGRIDQQKKELIRNFPIPNTKDDLLEFLTLAIPRAKKRGNMFTSKFGEGAWEIIAHNSMVEVWRTKCEQLILKARFSMKEDPKTLAEIERYATELKLK